MKDFTVSVKKLTDEELMREACETTFLGESHISLNSIYKSEHSPVRTQLFWVKFNGIPLFISTHLLRHHVGSVSYQLTCRDDRHGGNPGLPTKVDEIVAVLKNLSKELPFIGVAKLIEELDNTAQKIEWLKDNADRYTPVNLGLLVNAQSLIDMAKLRLCNCAHHETIIVFQALKDAIRKVDPDLASYMVRKCVYRNGLCGEQRCCGFNHSLAFQNELKEYLINFNDKQIGIKSELK